MKRTPLLKALGLFPPPNRDDFLNGYNEVWMPPLFKVDWGAPKLMALDEMPKPPRISRTGLKLEDG